MSDLLVICHPNDRFMTGSYLMHAMLQRLQAAGHGIKVQRHWDARPPADLVIPHVDLTVQPASLLAFLDTYPNVVNRRVTDISKRRISRHLVAPDDPWPGPVIVKTDRNYGGVIDRQNESGDEAAQRDGDTASGAAMRDRPTPLEHGSYEVHSRIAEVPDQVWRDPVLVVERYYAERKGALYAVRQLMICGDRLATRLQWGTGPVVKGENVVERSIIFDPPPANVVAYGRQLGLDYGKIDFTVVDGEGYAFDVARTPTGPALIRDNPGVIAFLAKGVLELAKRGTDRPAGRLIEPPGRRGPAANRTDPA